MFLHRLRFFLDDLNGSQLGSVMQWKFETEKTLAVVTYNKASLQEALFVIRQMLTHLGLPPETNYSLSNWPRICR